MFFLYFSIQAAEMESSLRLKKRGSRAEKRRERKKRDILSPANVL